MSVTEMAKLDPARSVIERFRSSEMSGERVIAELCGVDRTTVYNWMAPREKRGTDGLIPSRYHAAILLGAREKNIQLPAELLSGVARQEENAA